MEATPGSKHSLKHSLRWKVLLLLAGMGLVGLSAFYYHLSGSADRFSRETKLAVAAGFLISYAQQNGRYPVDIADALGKDLCEMVDLDSIEYVASGKSYQPGVDERLFYEKRPRRYGFVTGWYDVSSPIPYFRKGEPNNKAK